MKKVPPYGTGVGAQQDAVGDGAHGELAHAEVELTAVLAAVRPLLGGALSRGEGLSALEVGLVGAAEVGGAAPEFRHDGCDGVQSGAGSATGGDVLADFEGGLEVVDGLVEAFRKLAGLDAVVQGSLVRVGLAPCVVLLVPFLVGFETALGDLAGVGEGLFVNVEGLLRVVAEELLEAGDGLGAQLGAWEDGSLVLPGVGHAIRVSTLMSFGWFGAAARALAMVSARPSTSSL